MGIFAIFVLAVFAGVGSIIMRWGGSQIGEYDGFFSYLTQARWWMFGLGLSWMCGLGYAFALTRFNLTIAMSIYAGISYVVAVVGGCLLLREPLVIKQLLGCGCVFVGLFLLLGK